MIDATGNPQTILLLQKAFRLRTCTSTWPEPTVLTWMSAMSGRSSAWTVRRKSSIEVAVTWVGTTNWVPPRKSIERLSPRASSAISEMASSGVMKTPSRFDIEALMIAAATLPRAIEVKLIELCTVDGSRQMYSRPR